MPADDVLDRRRRLADGKHEGHIAADGQVPVEREVEITAPAPDHIEAEGEDGEDPRFGNDADPVHQARTVTELRRTNTPFGRNSMSSTRSRKAKTSSYAELV